MNKNFPDGHPGFLNNGFFEIENKEPLKKINDYKLTNISKLIDQDIENKDKINLIKHITELLKETDVIINNNISSLSLEDFIKHIKNYER